MSFTTPLASIAGFTRFVPTDSNRSWMAGAMPPSRPLELLTFPIVRAFLTRVSTTPSADFCHAIRTPYDVLSHDSVTHGRSPAISSTAFHARPPDLPPVPLMDTDFASRCSLVRHRRPYHPVLVHRPACLLHASFRPHLAVTPLRFARPSPPSGWSEDFHLQAVEHARRTTKKARHFAVPISRWT